MGERRAGVFLGVAEAAWRWVLDQVRWDDDGPWIPGSVPGERESRYRDGMHSGIGGLALTLAEVRLCREWTVEERRLAAAIGRRLRTTIATTTDYTYFDGLVSTIGVLTVLDAASRQDRGSDATSSGKPAADAADQSGRAASHGAATGARGPAGSAVSRGASALDAAGAPDAADDSGRAASRGAAIGNPGPADNAGCGASRGAPALDTADGPDAADDSVRAASRGVTIGNLGPADHVSRAASSGAPGAADDSARAASRGATTGDPGQAGNAARPASGDATALDTPADSNAAALDDAVARLIHLATPDGWPQTFLDEARFRPGARINDVVLGTAGVLLGAVWAHRHGAARARELATLAADVLMAEKEPGPNWRYVSERFRIDAGPQMPNFSHGLAGVATALALAGAEFARADLVDDARRGAEYLVTLADTSRGGFAVPHRIPGDGSLAYGWCHGPTGTSLLFPALEHAGVGTVSERPPHEWHRRCLHTVRTSGLPERRHPGFWDNDGRCCGTAGVADTFLDSWQRTGTGADLEFALHLADTLAARAIRDGEHAYWRFIEHTAPDPLLPPGVGWMQGSAGIAALLFRAARVAEDGRDAAAVSRMDSWWARRPPAGQPFASSSSSFL